MKFKQFLHEGFEIFGFDKGPNNLEDMKQRSPNCPHKDQEGDKPLKRFDVSYMVDLISKHEILGKLPKRTFFDTVEWGQGEGAIRLKFGTKYIAFIERKSHDLEGSPIWTTKRCYKLNVEYFAGKEQVVAEEMLRELNIVNGEPLAAPINNFKGFERLVADIANKVKGTVNDPLYFEEVKKLDDKEYIILFGVRGHGLQAPDQHRVELAQIHLKYHAQRGIIQVIEGNVESTLGQRSWMLVPSDYQLYFLPTQKHSEIINTISTTMKFY